MRTLSTPLLLCISVTTVLAAVDRHCIRFINNYEWPKTAKWDDSLFVLSYPQAVAPDSITTERIFGAIHHEQLIVAQGNDPLSMHSDWSAADHRLLPSNQRTRQGLFYLTAASDAINYESSCNGKIDNNDNIEESLPWSRALTYFPRKEEINGREYDVADLTFTTFQHTHRFPTKEEATAVRRNEGGEVGLGGSVVAEDTGLPPDGYARLFVNLQPEYQRGIIHFWDSEWKEADLAPKEKWEWLREEEVPPKGWPVYHRGVFLCNGPSGRYLKLASLAFFNHVRSSEVDQRFNFQTNKNPEHCVHGFLQLCDRDDLQVKTVEEVREFEEDITTILHEKPKGNPGYDAAAQRINQDNERNANNFPLVKDEGEKKFKEETIEETPVSSPPYRIKTAEELDLEGWVPITPARLQLNTNNRMGTLKRGIKAGIQAFKQAARQWRQETPRHQRIAQLQANIPPPVQPRPLQTQTTNDAGLEEDEDESDINQGDQEEPDKSNKRKWRESEDDTDEDDEPDINKKVIREEDIDRALRKHGSM